MKLFDCIKELFFKRQRKFVIVNENEDENDEVIVDTGNPLQHVSAHDKPGDGESILLKLHRIQQNS